MFLLKTGSCVVCGSVVVSTSTWLASAPEFNTWIRHIIMECLK